MQARSASQAWQICVRDSGFGRTEAQTRQLFQPFNRLAAELGLIPGTGIALALVQNLVRLMGGEVSVNSQPGQDSKFCVVLPATYPSEPVKRADAVEAACALVADAARPGLSLLYIEDNRVNVLLVEELIAMRGGLELVAVDGLSGVSEACARRPEVVLINMQLPDIDGFEVLRRLRAEPVLASTTMVALSANAMPEDTRRAREAGFDDYWTKPIDFAAFLGALDALALQHAQRLQAVAVAVADR